MTTISLITNIVLGLVIVFNMVRGYKKGASFTFYNILALITTTMLSYFLSSITLEVVTKTVWYNSIVMPLIMAPVPFVIYHSMAYLMFFLAIFFTILKTKNIVVELGTLLKKRVNKNKKVKQQNNIKFLQQGLQNQLIKTNSTTQLTRSQVKNMKKRKPRRFLGTILGLIYGIIIMFVVSVPTTKLSKLIKQEEVPSQYSVFEIYNNSFYKNIENLIKPNFGEVLIEGLFQYTIVVD